MLIPLSHGGVCKERARNVLVVKVVKIKNGTGFDVLVRVPHGFTGIASRKPIVPKVWLGSTEVQR